MSQPLDCPQPWWIRRSRHLALQVCGWEAVGVCVGGGWGLSVVGARQQQPVCTHQDPTLPAIMAHCGAYACQPQDHQHSATQTISPCRGDDGVYNLPPCQPAAAPLLPCTAHTQPGHAATHLPESCSFWGLGITQVEDMAAAEAALQAHGIPYDKFPIPGVAGPGQLFFFDPDGNGLELGDYWAVAAALGQ